MRLFVTAAAAAALLATVPLSTSPAKADPYMGPISNGQCWVPSAFNPFSVYGYYAPCPGATKASAATTHKRRHHAA